MPAVNGVAVSMAPGEEVSSLPAKRKRNDTPLEDASSTQTSQAEVQESIQGIWEVLKNHDTSPALLQTVSTTSLQRNSEEEPSTKRAKLSTSSSSNTIAHKIEDNLYTTTKDLVSDFDNVCAELLKGSKSKISSVNGAAGWQLLSETLEHERLAANLSALKKLLNSLVFRERRNATHEKSKAAETEKLQAEEEPLVNGVSHESVDEKSKEPIEAGRSVLTLFGNAQGHKQLFSSLQQPFGNAKQQRANQIQSLDMGVDSVLALREGGLPTGISSTRIVPLADETSPTSGVIPTIQDLFGPPPSVKQMVPPKTPKATASRDVTWSLGHPTETSSRRLGYTNEKLATGHWLGYGGIAPAEQPSSPQAKRKQRDRALSSGEASLTPSHGALAAHLQAKEDALFRSAYSSFMPSRDNSSAIVPEQTKNDIWWQKYGVQAFDSTFPVGGFVADDEEAVEGSAPQTAQDEEAIFKEAVENFEPLTVTVEPDATETGDKEADEILQEISQMLETLHSYQRIRMATVSSSSRTSFVNNTHLQDLTGTPTTPSVAEIETYKTLKSQLALMVGMLPPFALSKLNGDQLADLNISSHLPMEARNYRGVMEEDKASREARQAAFNAAVGAAAAQTRQSGGYGPGPGQFQGQMRPGQPPPGIRPNSFNPSQTMPRPMAGFSRQPLSSWQTPTQNFAPNINQRPPFTNPQAFSQQSPRPLNGTMRPQPPQLAPQRPGSSSQQVNGLYQTPNQAGGIPQRNPNFSGSTYNTINNRISSAQSPQRSMQRYPQQMQTQQQPQFSVHQSPPPQNSPTAHRQQQSPSQQPLHPPSLPAHAPQLSTSPQPNQPTPSSTGFAMSNGTASAGSRPATPTTPATSQGQGAQSANVVAPKEEKDQSEPPAPKEASTAPGTGEDEEEAAGQETAGTPQAD